MHTSPLSKALAAIGLLSAAGLSAPAMAASIDPASVTATIAVGETLTIHKTITLDATGAGVVDIFFLADNTGSMGGVINNVKSSASSLLSTLSSTYASAQFGVGRYLGDPVEFGETYDTAYQLQQSITSSAAATQTAINGWFASGGGDGPEANFYALHQVATEGADVPGTALTPVKGADTGSDDVTGWRAGSKKVVVWFGDVSSHNETITEAQTIAALNDNGVVVVGMNSSSNNFGLDGSYSSANGTDANQCDDVTGATGGSCIHNFSSVPAANVAATITAAIGSVTSSLDLLFGTSGDTSGLEISFVCTDPLGCDDVAGGESRTFDLIIKGLVEGTYIFDVFADGVSATERDVITVGAGGGGVAIPEPTTLALMGIGMLGAGAMRRKQRR